MNTIKIMFQFPVALVTSYHKLSDLKRQKFLGLPAVKSPPADAGSPGSTPGLGLCATTIEPVLSSQEATATDAHVLWSSCSAARGATLVRGSSTTAGEWLPLPAAGEKPESKKAQDSQMLKTLILSKHKFLILQFCMSEVLR